MRIAAAAVLLLLAAAVASATPTLTSIEPSFGVVYGPTRVIIRGTEFSESELRCAGEAEAFCPVTVAFVVRVGGVPVEIHGQVIEVSPAHIEVLAPAQPHRTVADVLVRVRGKGEIAVSHGFRWDNGAVSYYRPDYIQYLVPVIGTNLKGANGSIWSSEWSVRNGGPVPFGMIFDRCPQVVAPCENSLIVDPGVSRPFIASRGDGTDGAFVYLPKAVSQTTGMSLRARDVSANAPNFGAEVPIVRTTDFLSPLHLVDIPTDPRYRATMRIYGPGEYPHRVSVSLFADDGTRIEDYWVDLQGIVTTVEDSFPFHPAYAQIDLLSPAVRAAGGRVHVTIYSALWDSLVSPPPPIGVYAFVSVTNNETRQVTTVTPTR